MLSFYKILENRNKIKMKLKRIFNYLNQKKIGIYKSKVTNIFQLIDLMIIMNLMVDK